MTTKNTSSESEKSSKKPYEFTYNGNGKKAVYAMGFQSLVLILMFSFLALIVFVEIPEANQQTLTVLASLAFSAGAGALGYDVGKKQNTK